MSASAIEDTIVQPFERLLASVDGIDRVSSEASDGTAVVDIELRETIYDTELAWQRVREKVSEAQSKYGHLVTELSLDDRIQDTAGVVLTIESSKPLIDARHYALFIRDELYKLAAVRKIALIGDPGEQIEVLYSQASMLELGVSPENIVNQIAEANSLKNIGVLKGQFYQSNIASLTRIDDIEKLKAVEILSLIHISEPTRPY